MNKSISFCTTCSNRLWQIKETLQKNLESLNDEHELVLVDYGSSDGLSDWVWSNFKNHIENSKLVFFEVKNEVRWNMARAKNLAHRLASGEYLFNLDADNFATRADIELIAAAKHANLYCWQWSGSKTDGSPGRIGVPRKIFSWLGGYDETLLPMGGQDIDLLNRLNMTAKGIRLKPPELLAIQNSIGDKIREISPSTCGNEEQRKTYKDLCAINSAISKHKLLLEGPQRHGGGFSYKGLLNGQAISINGFDEITKSPNEALT